MDAGKITSQSTSQPMRLARIVTPALASAAAAPRTRTIHCGKQSISASSLLEPVVGIDRVPARVARLTDAGAAAFIAGLDVVKRRTAKSDCALAVTIHAWNALTRHLRLFKKVWESPPRASVVSLPSV